MCKNGCRMGSNHQQAFVDESLYNRATTKLAAHVWPPFPEDIAHICYHTHRCQVAICVASEGYSCTADFMLTGRMIALACSAPDQHAGAVALSGKLHALLLI